MSVRLVALAMIHSTRHREVSTVLAAEGKQSCGPCGGQRHADAERFPAPFGIQCERLGVRYRSIQCIVTQTRIPVKSHKFRGRKGSTLHLAIVEKKSQDVQTRKDLALHRFCIRSHGNDRSAKKSPRSPSCPGVELANKHCST